MILNMFALVVTLTVPNGVFWPPCAKRRKRVMTPTQEENNNLSVTLTWNIENSVSVPPAQVALLPFFVQMISWLRFSPISVGCKDAGGSWPVPCQLLSAQILSPGQSDGPLRAHMSGPRKRWDTDSSSITPHPPVPSPPPTCRPSCGVLARVNWADVWDRRGRRRRAAFPPEPPHQHAQIRGNLFHSSVASCFLRTGPHRRQRQRFGRWPSLFAPGSSFMPHVPSWAPHWSC